MDSSLYTSTGNENFLNKKYTIFSFQFELWKWIIIVLIIYFLFVNIMMTFVTGILGMLGLYNENLAIKDRIDMVTDDGIPTIQYPRLYVGEYLTGDFIDLSMPGKTYNNLGISGEYAKSIAVPAGYKVKIYSQGNANGLFTTLTPGKYLVLSKDYYNTVKTAVVSN